MTDQCENCKHIYTSIVFQTEKIYQCDAGEPIPPYPIENCPSFEEA